MDVISKPTVTLTFAGDEKKLTAAMDRVSTAARDMGVKVSGASDNMAHKSRAASDTVSRTMSSAAGNVIASFSQELTSRVTGFFSGMVSEAREAEKVSRSTAQGIATIGASSWTSVEAISALSESISNKIGVDDELIQSSANLLLTFKDIRNVAGENNAVFDRALLATQDLAAKGFGDADSAAKMLGKALNDPIAGITALSRAGVTFSEAQKDQIKKMVESGDLLGAQKMLLAEVESQVGGTAEATVDAGDKMATTWANFQENLGEAVLPILDRLLGSLQGVLEWAQRNPEIVAAIGMITAGIWLLNAALNANPIVLVTTLVAGLVIGLMILWERSAAFRDYFINMWDRIRDTVTGVVGGVIDGWNRVVGFFGGLPGNIGRALGSLGDVVSGVFKGAVNTGIDAINWFIRRANDLIYGVNVVNPFDNIPYLPQIARLHSGIGEVPGQPGQERLAILTAGETVMARGQGGPTSTVSVGFVGNTDTALASLVMGLVRSGDIVIRAA